MFANKIPPHTLQLLALLKDCTPEHTYLAGGTGLCIHLNHRPSYDLDLYVPEEFSEIQQTQRFEAGVPNFELISRNWQTILGRSQDTELSLFYYQYPLIETTITFQGFSIASISDIAAMKLEAISTRGLKRDFFDLYSICQLPEFNLKKILQVANTKYNRQGSYTPHYLKSLVYFTDAENLPERANIVDDAWIKVKNFFETQTPLLTQELLASQ